MKIAIAGGLLGLWVVLSIAQPVPKVYEGADIKLGEKLIQL